MTSPSPPAGVIARRLERHEEITPMNRFALTVAVIFPLTPPVRAALIEERFEGPSDFVTSTSQFVVGDAYFFNSGTSLDFAVDTEVELQGADGGFFAAQNVDAPPQIVSSLQSVTFPEQRIRPLDELGFSVDLAEDDDGDSEDWDFNDFVRFEISFDGGAFETLLEVASTDESTGGNGFNGFPLANGVEVTDTFQTFSIDPFPTNGAFRAVLRVVLDLDSNDEDIAIDNLILIPGPGTLTLVNAALLMGLIAHRGRRRV